MVKTCPIIATQKKRYEWIGNKCKEERETFKTQVQTKERHRKGNDQYNGIGKQLLWILEHELPVWRCYTVVVGEPAVGLRERNKPLKPKTRNLLNLLNNL